MIYTNQSQTRALKLENNILSKDISTKLWGADR